MDIRILRDLVDVVTQKTIEVDEVTIDGQLVLGYPVTVSGDWGTTPAIDREALRLNDAGMKIAAIKHVRQETGCGLKEAANHVRFLTDDSNNYRPLGPGGFLRFTGKRGIVLLIPVTEIQDVTLIWSAMWVLHIETPE